MALTERLAIFLETVGANTVVRDFERVSKSSRSMGTNASAGAKGLGELGSAGLASSAALKAGVAAAATIAAGKLVDFGRASISAASMLQEQMTAVPVIFGTASDSVIDFADKFSGALGLSRAEALDSMNVLGSYFKNVGASQEVAGEASMSLVQLAADLASFRDIAGGVPEVLNRIQSGLRGETEAIERLGVNVSAVAVKAKAAELGLGGVGRELTEGEKVAARYALIMEQTKDAQGDMARTGDSLANQQRKLTADIKRLQEEMGAALVPVARDVVLVFRGLVSVGRDVADVIGSINGAVEDASGGLGNLGTLLRVGLGVLTGGQSEYINWLKNQGRAADETTGSLGSLLATVQLGIDAHNESADAVKDVSDALLATSAAQRAYDASVRAVASAERTLTDARKDYNKLLKQGAVDEEKVADARRSLNDATRSLASANRRLVEVQDDYNDALNAYLALPTDTNADTLAGASNDLADAQDNVASAQERETEAVRELAEARAGDPEFNDKLAAAKQRVTDAEINLGNAQHDSAEKAYELDGALKEQNTLLATNSSAVASVRSEWEALLKRKPEIEAFLSGVLGAMPSAGGPGLSGGTAPTGPPAPFVNNGGGGDFGERGGIVNTGQTVIVNITEAVVDPLNVARKIIWNLN
jgi:hypothetical protein